MNINDFNNRIARCEFFLIASDGQFLGKLSLNRYDLDSISCEYGLYGSPYSSLSPYNLYTSTPPVIYLRGQRVGFLSKNKYLFGSIDPDSINTWMQNNRLYY